MVVTAIEVPTDEELAALPLSHLPELLRRISNERAFMIGDLAHGGPVRTEEAEIYTRAIRAIRERLGR